MNDLMRYNNHTKVFTSYLRCVANIVITVLIALKKKQPIFKKLIEVKYYAHYLLLNQYISYMTNVMYSSIFHIQ